MKLTKETSLTLRLLKDMVDSCCFFHLSMNIERARIFIWSESKKLHPFLHIFENRCVWNLQNWDSANLWVMDKKFEFFVENWEHVSLFLELLSKMDTTLKIHNLCNLKLHYFFKVWCQLGTHMYHRHSNCNMHWMN